jgi:polar amino acid transport system substrate-binding protein
MKKILIITTMLLVFIGGTVFGSTYKIMTEEYPPYNYSVKGKLTGLSYDVVKVILQRIGHPDNIKKLPWSRSYNIIQNKKGYMLFSMTRTKEREKMFKWVGPVASNKWVFFAKKGSNLKIRSLNDAKKVKKVGTYKDDATEAYLKGKGFNNLKSVINDDLNVKLLMAGRINLWITGELQGFHKVKAQGMSTSKIKKVFTVKNTQLYIAFSKGTSNKDIRKWQKALDSMKKDGTYKIIVKKYM